MITVEQVNDVQLTNMTHEEAVIFLRRTKDQVKLRLFRDSSQTPIELMSPISGQLISMDEKPKTNLRYNTIDFYDFTLNIKLNF